MSDSLIKALERSSRRGGKKRKASKKRRTKRSARKPTVKIRFRTKTVVKRVYVRKAAKKRAAHKRRKTSKKRRAKSGKRKLKFGSPAWRKKYMR